MAKKITELPAAAAAALTQLVEVVTDPAGSAVSQKLSVQQLLTLISPLILPVGSITLWSGNIASIPSGWALCNGSSGTPDLRNRFVVCANADDGGTAKSTILGSALQTGGETQHRHEVAGQQTSFSQVFLPAGNIILDSSPGGNLDSAEDGAGHQHDLSPIDTELNTATAPPFYALAYIMKL